MNRSTFLAAAGGALTMAGFPHGAKAAGENPITLGTPTGSIYGTLTLPANAGPYPLVLIIAGSGPTDRDGNSGPVRAGTYRLLAQALAASGIASVRYDKRGVGASAAAAPSESDLRFDTYVDDAVSWLRMLAADKRFSQLTIAGHSEGALIGTIAAESTAVHALVTLEGAGRPAYTVLREQLHTKLPPALYKRADEIMAQLQSGRTAANVPAELEVLFRPSVQPYLISWFKYDPAAEIANVRAPIAIVQGTADVQVTAVDAEALKRGAPAAQLVVVNGMNHMLKYAPDHSTPAATLRGYEDPSLPVDPQAVSAVERAAK